MPDRRADIAFVAGLALGIAVLLAFGFAAHRATLERANDFSTMWTGARAVLDGADPYDRAKWPQILATYGTQRSHEDFFGYPPWVTLALLPFGALPIETGSLLWGIVGIAVGALGVRTLLRAMGNDLPPIDTLAGLTLVASQPAIASFWDGQWGPLLAGATAASAAGIIRGRASRVLPAVAMLAKPQLFVFAAWALVASLVGRRQLRALAVLGAVAIVIVVVSSLALPGWYEQRLGDAFVGRISADRQPTTLAGALSDLLGPPGAIVAALAVVTGVGCALAFDRRTDAFLAVWLALSSAAAVYTWSYDHLVLVVPVVIATGVIARRSRRLALAFGASAFAFLLLVPTLLYAIADARQDESYSAVVPVVIYLACAVMLWPDRRFSAEVGP